MRSDVKLMISGFCAGIAIGIFALTSISASIGATSMRGDRLRAPERPALSYNDLDPRGSARVVEVAAGKVETIDYYDAAGNLVYRSDPAEHITTVAKGVVIPTPTAQERSRQAAQPRLVTADKVPASTAN